MNHKGFWKMMVRGRELVAAFLFDPDYSPYFAKRLVREFASYRGKATEQEYFRFVRLSLVMLFGRLANARQLDFAERVRGEFLPAPDRENLPMMESLVRARGNAIQRVRGGQRPGRG